MSWGKKSQQFHPFAMTLDDKGYLILTPFEGGDCICLDLHDCKISTPKKARKGQPHTLRLDLAKAGVGTQETKFLISFQGCIKEAQEQMTSAKRQWTSFAEEGIPTE